MLLTTIICKHCGNSVQKMTKEVNRQKKLGRFNFYCNLKCAGSHNTSSKMRELGRQAAIRHFLPLIHDPEHAAKARLGREIWKYKELIDFFILKEIDYIFEYPLVTHDGYVRIYDLCLPIYCLLIEFDGKYHQNSAYFYRDEEKNNLATYYGWDLIRISTGSNCVIPVESLDGVI